MEWLALLKRFDVLFLTSPFKSVMSLVFTACLRQPNAWEPKFGPVPEEAAEVAETAEVAEAPGRDAGAGLARAGHIRSYASPQGWRRTKRMVPAGSIAMGCTFAFFILRLNFIPLTSRTKVMSRFLLSNIAKAIV